MLAAIIHEENWKYAKKTTFYKKYDREDFDIKEIHLMNQNTMVAPVVVRH